MNGAEVHASRMMLMLLMMLLLLLLLLVPVSASALSRCSSLLTTRLATHY
jgi:hypothetical protein